MGLDRSIDDLDAGRAVHEERRLGHSTRLGTGTLACPACDAPVALPHAPMRTTDALGCPYCGRAGAVREFLSLAAPSRPARVVLRVTARA